MAASGLPWNQAELSLPNVNLFVGEVEISNHAPSLSEFLAVCARSLTTNPGQERERYSNELYQARDVFIQAGLAALAARSRQADGTWIQIGILPRERAEFCRQVVCLVRRLLNDSTIDNFFFMNKAPGMRLRFQTAAGGSEEVASLLYAEVARWSAEGLIAYVEPGVYEPESQLFGGPQSMRFVHALFTVDSLIWLDYHACRLVEDETINSAWLVSLAVLRTVFAGLDIIGWEDIGVWDYLRERAGRRLGGDQVSLPMYAAVADEIRDLWSRRDQIADELHPEVKALVARHDSALLMGAARWRSGYFCQRTATLGPRAAAARYVIFHWNRAALSATEQALLAESLSERVP